VPPRAHYAVDLQFLPDPGRLAGTETIHFRNETHRPIGRVALRWFGEIASVRANGARAERMPGQQSTPLFDLPADIPPGGELDLAIEFSAPWALNQKTASAITSFLSPQLWWGFGTLDDYEVRLRVPEGYTAGTSGRFDAAHGVWRADRVRVFGLFIGKGYETAESDAGDVHVRAVFIKEGRPCAELLLRTAVDAIAFYRERFGFYPHRSLTIAPGMDYPAGGYPPASALVVVHGQHRMAERPEAFWKWITAHEVGHMYWGDHVLAQGSDSLSWLMIGMGIRMDQEYRRARNIGGGTGALESNYAAGIMKGRDTTMDITPEQEDDIQWDFNNIVTHGKSIAMLNALESAIGAETFGALYRRALHDYAGRQLGWREFQRIAELESAQDLGWFFESWVRSSGSVFYRVAGSECAAATAGGFGCTVRIERAGATRMPLTIAARFQDGTEQQARTERLADREELHFMAKAPIREVVLDPGHAVVMADAPPTARSVTAKIRNLPWTGAGAAALEAYKQSRDVKPTDTSALLKLTLTLYDGRYYQEALDVAKGLGQTDQRFVALVWQGHLLDLLGRRDEAVAAYQEALKVPGTPNMRHDQYGLTLDKAWVEQRLHTPFERK
jgi:tetratricopeptide (TPR) repeat protein